MNLVSAKKKKDKKKKPKEFIEAMGNQVAGKILGDEGMKGQMPYGRSNSNKA